MKGLQKNLFQNEDQVLAELEQQILITSDRSVRTDLLLRYLRIQKDLFRMEHNRIIKGTSK